MYCYYSLQGVKGVRGPSDTSQGVGWRRAEQKGRRGKMEVGGVWIYNLKNHLPSFCSYSQLSSGRDESF